MSAETTYSGTQNEKKLKRIKENIMGREKERERKEREKNKT